MKITDKTYLLNLEDKIYEIYDVNKYKKKMNFNYLVIIFLKLNLIISFDIMWHIIIILTLVYWSLYKILKEYSWDTKYNKENFLLYFFYSIPILSVLFILYYYVSILNIKI